MIRVPIPGELPIEDAQLDALASALGGKLVREHGGRFIELDENQQIARLVEAELTGNHSVTYASSESWCSIGWKS